MTELNRPAVAQLVRTLPKAELHVHLEGTLEPELLFALARRNGVVLPWPDADALRAAYRFSDLASFLALFYEGCGVLRTRADFYDLTRAYLARAHADGVVRVEAFLGPQNFTERGVPLADILDGTLDAMRDARAEDGISADVILSAQRHRTEDAAFAQLDAVLPWADRFAGFGLGGAEVGNPPSKFERYFRELRRLGFRTCAHAGEEGPASYVREAVELLEVDRIDHGVRMLDDPALVRDLAAAGTPITVCPVSNVKLNVVATLAEHPLPAMIAAGLNVSIHSDDPSYFGAYLGDAYIDSAIELGLAEDDVRLIAANSMRSAFGR
jgi:adenosine deaminase